MTNANSRIHSQIRTSMQKRNTLRWVWRDKRDNHHIMWMYFRLQDTNPHLILNYICTETRLLSIRTQRRVNQQQRDKGNFKLIKGNSMILTTESPYQQGDIYHMLQTYFIDLSRGNYTFEITITVNKVQQFLLFKRTVIRKISFSINIGVLLLEKIILRPTMRKHRFSLTFHSRLGPTDGLISQGMNESNQKGRVNPFFFII